MFGIFALIALSSCGPSDLENGAVAHGEKLGAKKCECASATGAEALKCDKELISMNENYMEFLISAKKSGEDTKVLDKMTQDAIEKAAAGCK